MPSTVFITGSSTGIGAATARLFSQQGWQVAATLRTPADHPDLAQLPGVRVYALDVTDEAAVQTALAAATRDFGRLDVVINNAGYALFGPFETATTAEIARQFATNVFGAFAVIRHVLPQFRAQQSGLIINIASTSGRSAIPLNSLYSATKFALDGFSESLYFELATVGIGIKLILPGSVDTDFGGRSLAKTYEGRANPYQQLTDKVLHFFEAGQGKNPKPEAIAAVIYRAATDGRPTLRYAAGRQARFILSLRRLVPTSWYFALVNRRITN